MTQKSETGLSPEAIEEMLTGMVNVPNPWPWDKQAFAWVLTSNQVDYDKGMELRRSAIERPRRLYRRIFQECSDFDIWVIHDLLVKVWTSTDLRSKEWFCFAIRSFYAHIVRREEQLKKEGGEDLLFAIWKDKQRLLDSIFANSTPVPSVSEFERVLLALRRFTDRELAITAMEETVPPVSEFERVLYYLQRKLDKLRCCPNAGNVAPPCPTPYFFAQKDKQKYCSEPCAREAQLKTKRDWWTANRGKEKGRK